MITGIHRRYSKKYVDIWLADLIATNALIQGWVDEHGSDLPNELLHWLGNLDWLIENSKDWAK